MAADEVKDKKPTKKRKPTGRPPRHRAVVISSWSLNGSPIPDKILASIEAAVERELLAAFNEGHRLVTQTTRV